MYNINLYSYVRVKGRVIYRNETFVIQIRLNQRSEIMSDGLFELKRETWEITVKEETRQIHKQQGTSLSNHLRYWMVYTK